MNSRVLELEVELNSASNNSLEVIFSNLQDLILTFVISNISTVDPLFIKDDKRIVYSPHDNKS